MEAMLGVVSLALVGACVVAWRATSKAHQAALALVAAETKLEPLQQEIDDARDALHAAQNERDALMEGLNDAKRNQALAEQKAESTELRLREYEQLKTQFEQYAKAAALETGNQLSNKLLEDHKRAREETHKQFEQFTKTAKDELMVRQQELAQVLGGVQKQVDSSSKELGVLLRAMQNPIGAGAEGEIVMGNILQQHGFTPGQDYELQVHLAGDEGSLRPDCVIYLPNQHAIIVDSKASHHIFALFRAEGTPEFDDAFRQIQTSMRAHAKALGGKAYQDNLRKLKNRNDQPITRTTLVMFVPNDEVVTRLMHKDPNLMEYLREHDIVLAGPVTLSGIFLTARALVREARQLDAQVEIAALTSDMMADFITSIGYAEDVIKGISSSAKAYDKFGGSLRNALSKMRKLTSKGVLPAKNKQIPAGLARYSLHREDDIVQGEVEEVVEPIRLPKDAA